MKPFEQVVVDHGATVLRVVRALLGPPDSEDAWSETFLAALRAYPALDPGANVEAWLVTIARRKAIDALRSRTRRPIPVERVPEGAAPEDEWERDGLDEDLLRALGRLPERQREAVVYHHLAGLPYREVAGIVGGSEAAARRAAADGIAALRRARAGGGGATGRPAAGRRRATGA